MPNGIFNLFRWCALLGWFATLAACGDRLVDEISIPLPRQAELVVSYHSDEPGLARFEVTISNAHGTVRHPIWGDPPADGGNLYAAPGDRIVLLGHGGFAYMFEVKEGEVPRLIPEPNRPMEDGQKWEHLGSFVFDDGRIRFNEAGVFPERVDLLGAGSSPYRTPFQVGAGSSMHQLAADDDGNRPIADMDDANSSRASEEFTSE